jgi:hypothetical protein
MGSSGGKINILMGIMTGNPANIGIPWCSHGTKTGLISTMKNGINTMKLMRIYD